MAKKNMDILLGNILGKAAIHPQDRFDKSPGCSQEKQNPAPSPQTESDSPNNHGVISPLSAQRNSLTRFRASPERKASPSAPSWNTS